jgi:hypothetical protein
MVSTSPMSKRPLRSISVIEAVPEPRIEQLWQDRRRSVRQHPLECCRAAHSDGTVQPLRADRQEG